MTKLLKQNDDDYIDTFVIILWELIHSNKDCLTKRWHMCVLRSEGGGKGGQYLCPYILVGYSTGNKFTRISGLAFPYSLWCSGL